MPQRFIFATKSDLEPGLQAVESQQELVYIERDWRRTSDYAAYTSGLDIPELGIERKDEVIFGRSFLVLPSDLKPNVRPVPQVDGSIYYATEHEDNPAAMMFHPGGILDGKYLMGGEVAVYSEVPQPRPIYKTFVRTMTKGFVPVSDGFGWKWWIGPEAASLWDAGMELCIGLAGANHLSRRMRTGTKTTAMAGRMSYEDSCRLLQLRGFLDADDIPPMPREMPSYDDEGPFGVHFFRTGVWDDNLPNLTLPRTYFGPLRSAISPFAILTSQIRVCAGTTSSMLISPRQTLMEVT